MPSVGKFTPGLFSFRAAAGIQYSGAACNICVDLFSIGLFSNMAPKLKTQMKTTIPKKRNRVHPPQDLASSEDESGPQLQDLMDALAAIATRLSATEETLSTATRLAHKVSPPENQTTGMD